MPRRRRTMQKFEDLDDEAFAHLEKLADQLRPRSTAHRGQHPVVLPFPRCGIPMLKIAHMDPWIIGEMAVVRVLEQLRDAELHRRMLEQFRRANGLPSGRRR
jgi:hypothetical protein